MEMAQRFRGFLPVVVDLETGGFDAQRHAVLEIAYVTVRFDRERLIPDQRWRQAVEHLGFLQSLLRISHSLNTAKFALLFW